MKILIVDDENVIAQLVAIAARRAGVTASSIDHCQNLRDALHYIEHVETLDLLITDWNIPEGNEGGTIAKMVKARFPQAQIIVMTGRPENLPLIAEICAPDEFVPKPFSLENMILAIKRRLETLGQSNVAA